MMLAYNLEWCQVEIGRESVEFLARVLVNISDVSNVVTKHVYILCLIL